MVQKEAETKKAEVKKGEVGRPAGGGEKSKGAEEVGTQKVQKGVGSSQKGKVLQRRLGGKNGKQNGMLTSSPPHSSFFSVFLILSSPPSSSFPHYTTSPPHPHAVHLYFYFLLSPVFSLAPLYVYSSFVLLSPLLQHFLIKQ